MKMKVDSFEINDYLGHTFDCDCHREHTTKLEKVVICEDVEKDVLTYLNQHKYQCIYIVEDENTYVAYGKLLEEYLTKSGIVCDHVVLEKDVVPDEMAVFKILSGMQKKYDFIVGVGAGTLNDLCKFVSYKLVLDYAIVATAPSMDGYASIGSALIIDDLKTTFDCHVPTAIFGDLDVLANAPLDMIKAGLGDIVGKYNCLIDWKVANIINDEYVCQTIIDMVYKSIQEVVDNADGVLKRDKKAVKAISEALIETGMAMGFVGNSRPASGSEHHVSHYWEMKFLFAHKPPVFHGAKVGLATPGILALWKKLVQEDLDFEACKKRIQAFDYTRWEEKVTSCFEGASEGVLALEKKAGKNNIEEACKRLDVIASRWKDIQTLIEQELPQPEKVVEILKSVEAPYRPDQVGIDKKMVKDSLLLAKEVRVRYGLLQLLWDLGLLEEYSDYFVDYYESI
ncbi:sn-glycerol-1-phosphate dehydrogenase [Amedibacillus sp. YH-ame6]